MRAVAVDIGGTKLAAGLVDVTGALLHFEWVATTPASDSDALFAELLRVIDQVRTGDECVVGVGCGGPMTEGNELVSPLNIPA